MILSCDWTSIMENEGIGGVIIAAIWALWTYFKGRGQKTKSAYEK